jgi:geranyl-CoA carboxylase alpha subunit
MTARQSRPEPAAPQALTAHLDVPMRLIRKVLVANRGEIACRIMRTCRAMGIATVAVFSEADASARHVHEADEAIRIGPSAASASYLNIPAIIQAARRADADAIHPGYGFLSEQALFAQACVEAGITFIGPRPEVIARMGSKREARHLVSAAGVPVVPGYDDADQSDERLLAAAREIGFPILVKASAGGGGKGMRAVERAGDLPAALASARREALAAFGDATLLLERLIREPHHVEFQIFGDEHGHLLHLGERECSIQRRHQKVIEETPSTALTSELRARMADAALTVGRQLGYTNAGTVEFILDLEGHFFFLEVNTRLQVEHPITELVTGLDLVRWQIEIAEGRPLPLTQDEVTFTGHAIEARLYAEDPAGGFLPATGQVALWREATGDGVRVDSGLHTGDEIGIFYDPLLAKICAYGADRVEALRRLDRALGATVLFGPRNNLDFLRRALLHPAHVAGDLSTDFVERHLTDLLAPPEDAAPLPALPLAAVLTALADILALPEPRGWRNNPSRPLLQRYSPRGDMTTIVEVQVTPSSASNVFAVDVTSHASAWSLQARVHDRAGADLWVELDGYLVHGLVVVGEGGDRWVKAGTRSLALSHLPALPQPTPHSPSGTVVTRGSASLPSHAGGPGVVVAPMPGQVLAVLVGERRPVRAGDPVILLEAMKMEHTLRAPRDGVVAAIHTRVGEQVSVGAVLVDILESEKATS